MPNLVGIGLSQVPTNSMLGGMAYQDPDRVKIKKLHVDEISQINSEIADTAVDIFIYDTSKDSDGGAWRKRTTHTSWYNETLGTATRGTRREFPAVAVLVLQGTVFTIYDGDDPDLPMWMVFNKGSDTYFVVTTNSCVTALNGKIVSGGNASNDRLRVIDFLLDNEIEYSNVSTGQRTHLSPISGRNGTVGFTPYDSSLPGIVNRYINDVAMTVLPNAPIDASTGLPVPTIALATNGGVSVIKDDGTVVSGGEANSSWMVNKLIFDSNNTIWASEGTEYSPGLQLMSTVPYTSVASIGTGSLGYQLTSQVVTTYGRNTSWPFILGTYGNREDDQVAGKEYLFSGSRGGLTFLQDNVRDRTSSMVAYATTSYNTGWMHGDIKGAFLSDTTVESFSATNLVTEDFSANWTGATNGVLSVSNGQLTITNSGGHNGRAQSNTFATTSGKKYAFIVKAVSNSSASYRLEVRGPELVAEGTTNGQTLVVYFNGTGNSSTFVELYTIGGNGASTTYEDAYVVEIEEDRSVNNNGLQVFGTITKSAVATGADLVAYSGFSANNKLENRSDYDFGVGNSVSVCIIGWFKTTNISTYTYIMSVYDSEADDVAGLAINASGHGSAGRLYVYDNITSQTNGTTVVNDGQWHCAVGIFDGPNRKIYLDGKLEVSNTFTSYSLDIADTDKLVVGRYAYNDSYNFLGSLALTRISKSIPSPEQIKKMYEDEKVLFQENAKATLYGSSDAVTALAYDEVTDQLHVGTSSGRSDFQGLRRINNTTTAVTTAISAHDEFIIEQ